MHGVVKWFNSEKGFGFIEREDQTGDIFVHRSNIIGSGELREGDRVEYSEGPGRGGRPSAIGVKVVQK